ncbi:MAG: hypothetical protein EPN72_00430 [Nevskiaceae bacterium]|nr:MAG: hypothetical protein EPN63_09775 [Nevskiaceae bacterium]TBR75131.1 MAG: hypothetical protein EPN72_00430 [Nevskiaceae bacterium]
MSGIDRTSPLIDLINEKITPGTTKKNAKRASNLHPEGADESSISGATATPLRDTLAGILKGVDLNSETGRKAARISFIETVVLDRLDRNLARDPKFGLMVRKIESSLCEEEETLSRFDNLLAEIVQKNK